MRHLAALLPPSSFVRTGFTWSAYLMLGYYAFLQAALGPLALFLQAELHLTYTQTSLLPSAFALATLLVGLLGDAPARIFRRRTRFWGGAIGMWIGIGLLMVSPSFVLALLGSFLMGAFGTVVRTAIEGGLADLHQGQRATALTEANVIASIGATSVPLFIGGWQALELGWRSASFVPLLVLIFLYWRFRHLKVPEQREQEAQKQKQHSVPFIFWLCWLAMVCSVAMEWCMIVWSAALLKNTEVLSVNEAATSVSFFFVAEVLGRLIGSRLTSKIAITPLLLVALSITALGFSLFWLSPLLPLKLGGLVLTGLGIANLYPLILSAALSINPARANATSGRFAFGVGVAIFTAPLMLGRLADVLSIQGAYSVVPVLLVGAFVLTLLVHCLRGDGKHARQAPDT
ncbi:MFS transporter [Ktedonosporobacter rubrisoli]|uniref:MFS transporter n=1 Tax=Ktedonosporobacter rubrisoli TaxID=2509675 RepID=A0A4P6JLW9_KTERU|nr:MFS transporter [Ktedonosporobacter rubrisoli]QBD75992.1 MFS transporter [Ktedonosporobacter rubrisoli]